MTEEKSFFLLRFPAELIGKTLEANKCFGYIIRTSHLVNVYVFTISNLVATSLTRERRWFNDEFESEKANLHSLRRLQMLYKRDPSNFKQLLPGVFMKPLTYGENSLLCEFQLKQGSIIPAHQHPQEQAGYLISGRLRFSGDEGDFIVETGSSWNFKGGKIHGAEVLEDSVAIEIFSPVRQDYLA